MKTSSDKNQESVIVAETAIREETRKSNLEFAELSPFIRELLAKCYIRGAIDTLEKLKKNQKDIVEKM